MVMAFMLFVHWWMRDVDFQSEVQRLPWWLCSAVLAVMLVAIITTPGQDRAFIYFQF